MASPILEEACMHAGEYSYVWTTPKPRNYEVKTNWKGDDKTLANVSNVSSVTIEDVEDTFHTSNQQITFTCIWPPR